MGDAASVKGIDIQALALCTIEFASDAYQAMCALRHEVLRKPLGLDLYREDLAREKEHGLFGMFDGAELIACVIVVHQAEDAVKLRQMAVKPGYAAQGVGRALLRVLESRLMAQGVRRVSLHARVGAIGFYEKLGYQRQGEPFIEIGIPHMLMEKHMQPMGKA